MQSLGLIGLSQLIPKLQMPIQIADSNNNSSSSNSNSNSSNNSNSGSSSKISSSNSSSSGGSGIQMRCPMDFKPKDVPKDGIFGLDRVSRHATLWSFGFTLAGEAFRTIFIAEAAMFAFPLAFAAIGTTHQDSRFRRGMGGSLSPEYERMTSNVPFVALLTSKQPFDALVNEIKWLNVGVAVAISMMRAAARR